MTNITWTQDSFDYDNSDHTISVTNVPSGSTVTYTGGEDGTNGAKNDGLYTINATITNPNYKTWVGSHTLAIIFPENGIKLQDGSFYTIDTSGNFCTSGNSGTSNFIFNDKNGTSYSIPKSDITQINLTDLPEITSAPGNYLQDMFTHMTNLTNVNMVIPNTITSVGNTFCNQMFRDCTHLVSLSANFNLPQGITGTVGNNFCDSMFEGCYSLTSLPVGFNLPQNITSVGDRFCFEMFANCAGLKNDSSNLVTIHIPNLSGTSFCHNMFYGCSGLTTPNVPVTPTANSDIAINAN